MIDLVNLGKQGSKQLNSFSKYLSKLLRHTPEEIELSIDSEGWVSTKELIDNLLSFDKYKVDLRVLQEIVNSDNKGRYSFKDDFRYIRANQGHSCKGVNITFKEFNPTGVLYHGTAERFVSDILDSGGLKPMSRQYVHLSKEFGVAITVGQRHGKPRVFVVDALSMVEDGYKFYESENGVILVKEVPKKYLS